ncbi:CDP-alcohol phosphatidyltransferase family protein [Methylopila sp. M107]|uniref:CDP-alcohol phosphatidyltransferase family protein n=1 Tax=Methylopila sp. M107 TaxID=1101190 RepID=UPI00036E112F|nr:CDP-alcohol phosphatidyltransferase family protein [Methylopila sp. M107]
MPSEVPDAPLDPARRPIASRDAGWAKAIAARLAASSVTPNQISGVSVVFAAIGCALIGLADNPLGWLFAALCVQLRLVCNLLDGMVAIEGGKKSAVGAIWNEFPDRVADTLLLVPIGYAAGIGWAGWAAALLAALTAYVRVFGGSLGLTQDFSGIMAKQRRMALLTVGLVAQSIEWTFSDTRWSLGVAIVLIAAGSAITCATRTLAIGRELEAR